MKLSKGFRESIIKLLEVDPLDRAITQDRVKSAISRYFPKHMELLDDYYFTCTKDEMENILKNFPIVIKEFKSDIADCDNYAKRFVGIMDILYPHTCTGIVTITTKYWRHALVVWVSNKGIMYFIEPQQNKIYTYHQYRELYQLTSIDNVLL